jgi:hypothetical protein
MNTLHSNSVGSFAMKHGGGFAPGKSSLGVNSTFDERKDYSPK